MIVTCVAILAVDFKIFPRRFAKVETWGTSLMDMGVGSFVFSAGIVSARPMIKDALAGRSSPIGSRLLRSLRHSLPLFVFGLVRLYAVKGLDFAEHVSEYGVHWNFFFTLALLPPSIALLQSLLAAVPSISILALFLGALYELSLHFTNLQRYVLTSARTNILNQNREGIFSFFGYLSIFLAGQAVGLIALPRMVERKGIAASGKALRRDLLIRLTRYSIIWSSLMFLASSSKFGFDLKVSRRLANLPYILWVSAFNCTQLTVFCVIETLLFPGVYKAVDKDSEKKECNNATSRILKAYNRNGLAIFLLANPLTGLVNKTVDTLNIDRIGAIGILIVYTGLLTGVAMALDQMDLSIKF